jgi:hypothetical protein
VYPLLGFVTSKRKWPLLPLTRRVWQRFRRCPTLLLFVSFASFPFVPFFSSFSFRFSCWQNTVIFLFLLTQPVKSTSNMQRRSRKQSQRNEIRIFKHERNAPVVENLLMHIHATMSEKVMQAITKERRYSNTKETHLLSKTCSCTYTQEDQ